MQHHLPLPDVAVQVEAQLQEIRAALKEADEVYRRFRAAMLVNSTEPRNKVPVEWIPISNH
jgi:hypothetical protein